MSIELKDEWVEKAEAAIQNAFWDDAKSRDIARAALTSILPLIEAEVRETCAKVAENYGGYQGEGDAIAAAIREGDNE